MNILELYNKSPIEKSDNLIIPSRSGNSNGIVNFSNSFSGLKLLGQEWSNSVSKLSKTITCTKDKIWVLVNVQMTHSSEISYQLDGNEIGHTWSGGGGTRVNRWNVSLSKVVSLNKGTHTISVNPYTDREGYIQLIIIE